MNLIKIPFFIGENNVILPPTESNFTLNEENGIILFEHPEFPHDKERLLSDDCILKNMSNLYPKNHSIQAKEKENCLRNFSKACGHQKQ